MKAPASSQLQSLLQTAVQSVQWTYSIFWEICPRQGNLIWGDGYYNGGIKTRKTVEPMEVNDEDECPLRSQQLRELYDSLVAGKTSPAAKWPCVALSPEDLTESEWFYLMCVSFSFPPGVGLPGKAYSRKQHVWLTNANKADSKTFCRTILAKSAGIKTVLCIPLLNGVVEIGTVDEVEEDLGFVQRVKDFFSGHILYLLRPLRRALSAHSASASATSFDLHNRFNSPPLLFSTIAGGEEEDNVNASDSEAKTERYGFPRNMDSGAGEATVSEPSEILHVEMEDIPVRSPDDESNTLELDFQLLDVDMAENQMVEEALQSDMLTSESNVQVPELVRDLCNRGIQAQRTGSYPLLTMDDDHYSETVSTILQNQWHQPTDSLSTRCTSYSTQSAFQRGTLRWLRDHLNDPMELEATPQWLLKCVLFSVPLLHAKHYDENLTVETLQGDFNTNHILAERHRREKFNERFNVLRSLIPLGAKIDKISILGDTIEYVKQLHKNIHDLENIHDQRSRSAQQQIMENSNNRMMGEGSGGAAKPKTVERLAHLTSAEVDVQVSIIGSDTLLELRCPFKEGLLLDVMQVLRKLLIDITTIQSFSCDGIFLAELKAKVNEDANGKKASIVEVKRAIKQIIP